MKSLLNGTRYDFSRTEWKAHLDVFTTLACTEKRYAKMAYKTWREVIKDYENSVNTNFSVCFTANSDEVRVYSWRNAWEFSKRDGSFGEYLHNQIVMEVNNMGDKYDYGSSTSVCDTLTATEYAKTYNKITTNADYYYTNSTSGVDTLADYLTIKADQDEVNRIQEILDDLIEKDKKETPMNNNESVNNKENKNMKFNFDFGPVNPSTVRMSMYGLAVKNKSGAWVSFDSASGNIVDVDIFNFDGAKFLYKMPVAVKDIAVGDVVIHNGAPMFVLAVGMKTLSVVDVINGERKEVMLARSPFGFDFATKVVNFLGNMTPASANADNPFGNMWMLMAMSGNSKMEDMLPMALMMGGMDMSNPMMLWALMDNRTNDPMMLAMAMGAFNKPAAPAHTCNCGSNCGEAHT
jgi:hypothetical protein